NNPAIFAASGRHAHRENGHWGEAHAISAWLDGSVHQSGLRRARTLVARSSLRSQCGLGVLPVLRKHVTSRTSAHRPAPAHEAAPACRAPTPPPPSALTQMVSRLAQRAKDPRPPVFSSPSKLPLPSAFEQAPLHYLFVPEPQVRNVRRTEPQDVFERTADFIGAKVDAHLIEQVQQRLGAFGQQRFGSGVCPVKPVIGQNIY